MGRSRSGVNKNTLVLPLYFLQVLKKQKKSVPEGSANSLSFRGLKPPAPSEIFDLQLYY
jgi:hypothetical protein